MQGTDDFCILRFGRGLATTQCNRLSNMTSQGRTKLCVEVKVFQWEKKTEGYITTQLTLFVKASGVKKKGAGTSAVLCSPASKERDELF